MNRNLPRVAYRPREAAEVTGLSVRFLLCVSGRSERLKATVETLG